MLFNYSKLKIKNQEISLKEISEFIKIDVSIALNTNKEELFIKKFLGLESFDNATEKHIVYLIKEKYIDELQKTAAILCVTSEGLLKKIPEEVKKKISFILTDDPKSLQIKVMEYFSPAIKTNGIISKLAYISSKAKIGKNCQIDPFVVIKDNVVIGDNCIIFSHVAIEQDVVIGENCHIEANVNIQKSKLGNDCKIKSGANIGGQGFGYNRSEKGHQAIPHNKLVIIGNNVDIGNNSCIDRGHARDTIIGDGTKIDNLVQIGHNVQMGKGCLICGNSGIAGSTTLGNFVILAGDVAVSGHLTIVDRVIIGPGSGLTKNILKEGVMYLGYPAKEVNLEVRDTLVLRNIIKKYLKDNEVKLPKNIERLFLKNL